MRAVLVVRSFPYFTDIMRYLRTGVSSLKVRVTTALHITICFILINGIRGAVLTEFKLPVSVGEKYEASCVFTKTSVAHYIDVTRSVAQDDLLTCKLEDCRSIVPIEEGVYRVVNTDLRLYVEQEGDC